MRCGCVESSVTARLVTSSLGLPGMEDALSGHESVAPVTGEELLRMPWLNPCELVGGRIVRMTPTNPTHGRIEVNVAVALGTSSVRRIRAS